MDPEILIEDEEQFWDEIDDIVSTPCHSHDRIDDTLRTWLEVSSKHQDTHLQTESDVTLCSRMLLDSPLLEKHSDYIRTQLVYALLQEDEPCTVHLIAAFLFLDGLQREQTFELMKRAGAFNRLVELIKAGFDDDRGLLRVLLELLYEMSRIQMLSVEEISCIDDGFVIYLFQIIEDLANDVNDPYHVPVIRVLLVLNEQYMVSATTAPFREAHASGLTNRVIKVLSLHGRNYKTFGGNIILLLNRESEPALQLLILKLLYLMFTHESTQEYFYTNDLHVLIDILIRNLLDLPAEPSSARDAGSGGATSLRHTYLRVLHPLVAYTQLRRPPHYKREQLRKLLFVLANNAGQTHFDEPDETTVRLVTRCLLVEWIKDHDDEKVNPELLEAEPEPKPPSSPSLLRTKPAVEVTEASDDEGRPGMSDRNNHHDNNDADADADAEAHMDADLGSDSGSVFGMLSSPMSPALTVGDSDQDLDSPSVGQARAGQAIIARKLAGMNLKEGRESSLSVADLATAKAATRGTEKPAVPAPRRSSKRKNLQLP